MAWGWPCCCDRAPRRELRVVFIQDVYYYQDQATQYDLVCLDGNLETWWAIRTRDVLGLGFDIGPGNVRLRNEEDGNSYVYFNWAGRTGNVYYDEDTDPGHSNPLPMGKYGIAKLRVHDASLVWNYSSPEYQAQGLRVTYTGGQTAFLDFDRFGNPTSGSPEPNVVAFSVDRALGTRFREYDPGPPGFGFNFGFPVLSGVFDDQGRLYATSNAGSFNGQLFYWSDVGTLLGSPFATRNPANGPASISASGLLIKDGILYDAHYDTGFFDSGQAIDTEFVGIDPLDLSPRAKIKESDFEANFALNTTGPRRIRGGPDTVIVANMVVSYAQGPSDYGPPSSIYIESRGNVCGFPKGTIGGLLWQTKLWLGDDGHVVAPISRIQNQGGIQRYTDITQPCYAVARDPVSGRTFAFTYPMRAYNVQNGSAQFAPYYVIELNPQNGIPSQGGWTADDSGQSKWLIWDGDALTVELGADLIS